jgi:transcriptional regulator with XRE-family HTH domain
VTREGAESLREARETLERRDQPRDEEEAAELKRMGQTVTSNRERRGMTREELAPKSGMTVPELERLEAGEVWELWGDLGKVAKGLGMHLYKLFMEYEGYTLGPGGEKRRQSSGEAESDSTVPGTRGDAAEEGKRM